MGKRYSNKIIAVYYFISILVVKINVVSADELIYTCTFSSADINFQTRGEYKRVELVGCDLTEVIGKPQLPEKIIRLALPAKTSVLRVTCITDIPQLIASDILVYPAQPRSA